MWCKDALILNCHKNDILDYDHCSCDYLCSALLQSHSFMNFRPSVSNGYLNWDALTSKLSMLMVRWRGS